jgi:hypothetical protein
MEKARQGVRVGNEVRQRASKNLEHSPIWLFYYFTFFFDFSVAFVAGEENSL